jgi:hypothetical protein
MFGKPRKIAMSQRDVPGMTRSVIPLLKQAGVQVGSVVSDCQLFVLYHNRSFFFFFFLYC